MAALKAHEADRAIARPNPDWRVWLIYGPDAGLVSERANAIAGAALGEGGDDPFRLVRLEGDDIASDPARLVDEARTIGLFGGERVIRVSRSGKPLLAAVEPLLRLPPEDARIIIEAGELTKKNPLLVAVTASSAAVALPCYADDARGIEAMLDSSLHMAGLSIDRDARQALAASLGNDRLISRQEIEKLVAYVGDARRIELADVAASVGDSALRETDTLSDAVFTGELELADQTYVRLLAEGEEAGVVAGAVCRHAAQLLATRLAVEAGQSREAALGRWRFPYPRKKAIETALTLWTSARLAPSMAALMTAAAASRREPTLGPQIVQRALIALCRNARSVLK